MPASICTRCSELYVAETASPSERCPHCRTPLQALTKEEVQQLLALEQEASHPHRGVQEEAGRWDRPPG